MLSLAQRAVRQHFLRRTVSNAAASHAATQSLANAQPSIPSTRNARPPSSALVARASRPPTIAPALPVAHPVYVQMSSLLYSTRDEAAGKVAALDPTVFNHPLRRDILHLCVVHYRDGLRQGSASTKTRAEVNYSGRKLRPQKGTGKARLGSRGNPMLRGGGVVFGPKPRDFSTRLPRKVIQLGMRVALSAKLREEGLGVVPSLAWPEYKTKLLGHRIDKMGWRKTLFVHGEPKAPKGLGRSANALEEVDTRAAADLTVYDILQWKRVILDVEAVQWLEQNLSTLDRHTRPSPSPSVGKGASFNTSRPTKGRRKAVRRK